MDNIDSLIVKQVFLYDFFSIIKVAQILKACGKDMARKYNLNHWDNPMIKTIIIVLLCLLKNNVYLVYQGDRAIATFQYRFQKDAIFSEKLGVIPEESGKGYGSFCTGQIIHAAKTKNLNKLRTEVYDKSKFAIDYHLQKGYKTIGTAGTLKRTVLIMEKEI